MLAKEFTKICKIAEHSQKNTKNLTKVFKKANKLFTISKIYDKLYSVVNTTIDRKKV